MKIYLPNSAHLHNIEGFVRRFDPTEEGCLTVGSHPKYVHVHPLVLAMTACAAEVARLAGGQIETHIAGVKSLPYLIRMGLFDLLETSPLQEIQRHDEGGRFIPIVRIQSATDLKDTIHDLIPLLHAPAEVFEPIRVVLSELGRNALEHANSPVGAFLCAQYYRRTKRVSVGIADAGVGIYRSILQSHRVRDAREAILLALTPGISGTTERIGGNEFNAGLGLYYAKSIAALSRNYFVIYTGDCLYKLKRWSDTQQPDVHMDPNKDYHGITTDLPTWRGTVMGINIGIEGGPQYKDLLRRIESAYSITKVKKNYHERVKFR